MLFCLLCCRSVIVGDDIVDSDGDIVAIEEDTDDHLEEWIRAEAQQRRSLSHQDKVTADWSGLDSPEDGIYIVYSILHLNKLG